MLNKIFLILRRDRWSTCRRTILDVQSIKQNKNGVSACVRNTLKFSRNRGYQIWTTSTSPDIYCEIPFPVQPILSLQNRFKIYKRTVVWFAKCKKTMSSCSTWPFNGVLFTGSPFKAIEQITFLRSHICIEGICRLHNVCHIVISMAVSASQTQFLFWST